MKTVFVAGARGTPLGVIHPISSTRIIAATPGGMVIGEFGSWRAALSAIVTLSGGRSRG